MLKYVLKIVSKTLEDTTFKKNNFNYFTVH